MKCSLGPCSRQIRARGSDDAPAARIRRLFVAEPQLRHPALANDNGLAGGLAGRPSARLALVLAPLAMAALIIAVLV